jgi:hypothetical protein
MIGIHEYNTTSVLQATKPLMSLQMLSAAMSRIDMGTQNPTCGPLATSNSKRRKKEGETLARIESLKHLNPCDKHKREF